jgi:hypothetical protein
MSTGADSKGHQFLNGFDKLIATRVLLVGIQSVSLETGAFEEVSKAPWLAGLLRTIFDLT